MTMCGEYKLMISIKVFIETKIKFVSTSRMRGIWGFLLLSSELNKHLTDKKTMSPIHEPQFVSVHVFICLSGCRTLK